MDSNIMACRLLCATIDNYIRCRDECIKRDESRIYRETIDLLEFKKIEDVINYISFESKKRGVVIKAVTPKGIVVARNGKIMSGVGLDNNTCLALGLDKNISFTIGNNEYRACIPSSDRLDYIDLFKDRPELNISKHPIVMAVTSIFYDFIDDYEITKFTINPDASITGVTRGVDTYINVVSYVIKSIYTSITGVRDVAMELIDTSIHEYIHHLDGINTIIEHGYWGATTVEELLLELLTRTPIPRGAERRVVRLVDIIKDLISEHDPKFVDLVTSRAIAITNEIRNRVKQVDHVSKVLNELLRRDLIDSVKHIGVMKDDRVRIILVPEPKILDLFNLTPNDEMYDLIEDVIGSREADRFADLVSNALRELLDRRYEDAYRKLTEAIEIAGKALNIAIDDIIREVRAYVDTIYVNGRKSLSIDIDIETLRELGHKLIGTQ